MELSLGEARRIALSAQGFGRRSNGINVGHVRRAVALLGAVQIDAVNVLVRSHYLPVYSRLGPYDPALFDRLVRDGRAFEYWGHQASFLPVELHSALRWRMAENETNKHWLATQERIETERPGYIAAVMTEITERGPLALTDLQDPARREKVPTKYAESSILWWRWSDGKAVLDGLYGAGRLAVVRGAGFDRRYDLAERALPKEIITAPAPAIDDAQRALIQHAAKALGVASIADLADYFRMPVAVTRARVRELVDAGLLLPAQVESWSTPAFADPSIRGAAVAARALLSPFDSLLWERTRNQRLFGFQHSFELYVKPAKRRFGYYVLPFLLNEAIVARVDLKADRPSGTLLVPGAFAEPGAGRDVAGHLAAALREMAGWLNLERIEIGARGDLIAGLRSALR